jgi:hypothetical protein
MMDGVCALRANLLELSALFIASKQNGTNYPSEGSLSMKNVKVSSMRRKWLNEEA